jgi:DNA-binding LytR/AlgR family response regulator
MYIVLCDDEPVILDVINNKILKICADKGIPIKIKQFTSAIPMLKDVELLSEEMPVYFLDIDMHDMNGFEAADKLKQQNRKHIIVFVTNKDELVYESFKYQPFYFIRKSHLDSELSNLLVSINRKIEQKPIIIKVKSEGVDVPINVDDIEYIESYFNYVYIYSKERIKVRTSMRDIIKELPEQKFYRVQSGFIVNIDYCIDITSSGIILNNTKVIPVSREMNKMMKKVLMEKKANE